MILSKSACFWHTQKVSVNIISQNFCFSNSFCQQTEEQMKINIIKIKGLFDESFDVYLKTDNMSHGCDSLFCNACDLARAIDFLFLNKSEGLCDGSAQCEFEYAGCKYTLSRTKSFDNVASLLREQKMRGGFILPLFILKVIVNICNKKYPPLLKGGYLYFSRKYYTRPLKPMNAIARSAAVISAIGTPSNAFGTSSNSSLSRIPANSTSATAKPRAVDTLYTRPSSRPYSFCTIRIATPSTAQFVVISGRKIPSAW